MGRLSVAMLVLVISVSITPGVRELVLDLAHFVGDGHVAHAVSCDDTDDDEHGCTGPFHACACHASMSMTATEHAAVPSPVLLERCVEHQRSLAAAGPHGHLRELLRPPTA